LASLGLSEHAQLFAENDVDLSVLPHLTDQDLKELGLSLGHRRKLLAAIAQRATAAASEPGTQASPAVEPKPADTAERRQLTVMFTDLVGSTALSTRVDPEDLRGIINVYHHCCTAIVERQAGFVAKYMGDGVLAYFGYPRASEHDAEQAVRAALALIEAVPKLETAAGAPLQVRVGIATGLVVVGDLIGAGAAQEQAVVGETPNLAARLQGLADPGTVVISAATRRLTGGLFEYRDLGAVSLKGFGENINAWQVLGASAAESRFEALRATLTPLIGRDEETDLLMRRWEQAKRGDGQVVLISGEPGIGKSRIAQTIVERVGADPHTRLRYFCSPHHQDTALYPSIAQLQRAAGFRREDTSEERLSKLEAILAQGANDLSQVVPVLADLMSIPTGDRYSPLDLAPQRRKEKMLAALVGQVEGLAVRQPVLVLFEDVHWSDPTTRDALDLLVDRVATLRVLAIVTFRPEFAPPWIGRPHVTMLNLNRLPRQRRADMIAQVTGGKALPRDIAEQIIDRTDGIPLFIEELTKTVIESGVVTAAGDHYTLAGPMTPLAIPTSLHASLLARLDRLAPTREIAQIGAALGRSFSHELISAVAPMRQQQVDDALMQLVNAELIFRRGMPPDAEYTFKHALVQDAAYSTLLRSRRQQLHARIAATLEDRFPELVLAQPELAALHATEAGLADKAVVYRLNAGQRALARSAMLEAVAQLRKGLAALAGLPDGPSRLQQELDLQVALGTALTATEGWSGADVSETFARARALAEEINRPDYLVRLLAGQYTFHFVRAEYRLALPLAEQLEKIGQARNDAAAELLGRSACGMCHFIFGQFVVARPELERCLALADPARRTLEGLAFDPYAVTLTWLGLTLAYLGYLDQARSRMNDAVSEARRLGHAHTLAHALIFSSWLDWFAGAPMERLHEALDLTRAHDFPHYLGWALAYRGKSLVADGRAQDGLAVLTRASEILRATGNGVSMPMLFSPLAEACAALGRHDEEQRWIDEMTQAIESTDERVSEAELLHRVRGDLLNSRGDPAGAERCYREAIAVAGRQGADLLQLRASTSLARLWRAQGRRAEAHGVLAPIYGRFTEGFDTPVLKEAKALLEQLG
jgi:class 3 adenylate cyclase/tetratricopeptide (TPR) repeat protein